MREHKKKNFQFIYSHIVNNSKEYWSVIIIFIIGIVLGVIALNNAGDLQKEEIQNFINIFISNISDSNEIDHTELLKNNFTNNIILIVLLTLFGSTVIGIPIVYGIVGFKGFCLSYTISSIIAVIGSTKGFIFVISSIFLQNLIYIPCILALAVSGIRLYKSITKDKNRENIKIEILRHLLFSFIIGLIFLFGTLIETYISTNILKWVVQYL